MSFTKDFKDFISRGNVVDLAVGVIIGGAFGKIVDSLVKDLIMPPISYLLSGVEVSSWKLPIAKAVYDTAPLTPTHPVNLIVRPEVDIAYGNFVQAGLNFFIIALVIFVMVRLIQRFRHAPPAAAPGPTTEQLLSEIRDLLAKQQSPEIKQ